MLSKISDNASNIEPYLWEGSCLSTESTLHQIAPYIGKMKSSMAKILIENYSSKGDIVGDPFIGSGVVALESLIAGRGIIAGDINPYAVTLTKAKLYCLTHFLISVFNSLKIIISSLRLAKAKNKDNKKTIIINH